MSDLSIYRLKHFLNKLCAWTICDPLQEFKILNFLIGNSKMFFFLRVGNSKMLDHGIIYVLQTWCN
jgi:hypothetical protein